MLCWFFCCTMKWISCMCTYISFLLNLPPISHFHSALLEHQAELPATYSGFPIAISFTYSTVYISVPLLNHLFTCQDLPLLSLSWCFLKVKTISSYSPDPNFQWIPVTQKKKKWKSEISIKVYQVLHELISDSLSDLPFPTLWMAF